MCGSVCVCVCAQRNAVVVMVIVGGYKFYKSDRKVYDDCTLGVTGLHTHAPQEYIHHKNTW